MTEQPSPWGSRLITLSSVDTLMKMGVCFLFLFFLSQSSDTKANHASLFSFCFPFWGSKMLSAAAASSSMIRNHLLTAWGWRETTTPPSPSPPALYLSVKSTVFKFLPAILFLHGSLCLVPTLRHGLHRVRGLVCLGIYPPLWPPSGDRSRRWSRVHAAHSHLDGLVAVESCRFGPIIDHWKGFQDHEDCFVKFLLNWCLIDFCSLTRKI